MTTYAYIPDLMDRSKVTAARPEVVVVARVSDLAPGPGDTVLVDLSRPGVIDVLPGLVARGARVIGFGSHVDRQRLDVARATGAEVMARSAFFGTLSSGG